MDGGNQEGIFCKDDGEYRVYCENCDKLCIERLYKNYLKSGNHIKNIQKRQQFNKSFQIISLN